MLIDLVVVDHRATSLGHRRRAPRRAGASAARRDGPRGVRRPVVRVHAARDDDESVATTSSNDRLRAHLDDQTPTFVVFGGNTGVAAGNAQRAMRRRSPNFARSRAAVRRATTTTTTTGAGRTTPSARVRAVGVVGRDASRAASSRDGARHERSWRPRDGCSSSHRRSAPARVRVTTHGLGVFVGYPDRARSRRWRTGADLPRYPTTRREEGTGRRAPVAATDGSQHENNNARARGARVGAQRPGGVAPRPPPSCGRRRRWPARRPRRPARRGGRGSRPPPARRRARRSGPPSGGGCA